MDPPVLARPVRGVLAGLFCALSLYAVGGHLLPWALARLPLTAPLVLFFAVGLLSVLWVTLDILRGRL